MRNRYSRWALSLLAALLLTQTCDGQDSRYPRRERRVDFFGLGGFLDGGASDLGYYQTYGFNPYVYDPYRTGSFRPPDLLDDPHFQARMRAQYPRATQRRKPRFQFRRRSH